MLHSLSVVKFSQITLVLKQPFNLTIEGQAFYKVKSDVECWMSSKTFK
jgi:hypothetical protein